MTVQLPALNRLAERISEEHQSCRNAAQAAVEHAIRAGELLIEAKSKVPHGQWLSWLEGNCGVAERTAQAYMRLARELPKLEPEKAQRVAGLPFRQALAAVAESDQAASEEDPLSLAGISLNSPFSASDFHGDGFVSWIRTKLLHQLETPAAVSMCLGMHDEYGLPALRLCEGDDLYEMVRILVPLAKGEQVIAVGDDFTTHDLLHASLALKLTAQRIVGICCGEIEHRQRISAERLEREYRSTHTALMAELDRRLAEIAESRP